MNPFVIRRKTDKLFIYNDLEMLMWTLWTGLSLDDWWFLNLLGLFVIVFDTRTLPKMDPGIHGILWIF